MSTATDERAELVAPAPTDARGARRRLVGVDAFRGGVLALMVFTPVTGDPGGSYPHLAHAAWDGFTVSDAILPAFLVTSGASLALLLRRPAGGALRLRLVRRLLALLVLGVLYNAVGGPLDLGTVRLTGVLQMIGVSGALAAVVLLAARRLDPSGGPRALLAVATAAVAVPAAYGVALARGACPAALERCNPLHSWDVRLLGASRTYAGGELGYDPEGVGPTLAATALVLLGALAMGWLLHRGTTWRAVLVVVVLGALLVGVGLLLDGVQPVNKRLQTPAFTAVAGGLGVVGLGVAIVLWDLGRAALPQVVAVLRAALAWPLVTLGINALMVYLTERLALVALATTTVAGPDGPRPLQQALVGVLLPVEGPRVHLALTAVVLVVVLAVTAVMRGLRWRVVL